MPADRTPLGRPPTGGRKAADLYEALLAAEPHATAERREAVHAGFAYFQCEAGYTRIGPHGTRVHGRDRPVV